MAAGSSTYNPPAPTATPQQTNPSAIDCNSKTSRVDRISCRLEHGGEVSVPEACKGLPGEKECKEFYDRTKVCYDQPAKEKDRCFRQKSEYDFSESNKEKQYYVVALLYQLQYYVEEDYKNGKMSSEQAASFIEDIVKMKRDILSGKAYASIRSMLSAYRNRRGT